MIWERQSFGRLSLDFGQIIQLRWQGWACSVCLQRGNKGKWDQPISAGSQHGHPLCVGCGSVDREGLWWALELSRDISALVLISQQTWASPNTILCVTQAWPILPDSAKGRQSSGPMVPRAFLSYCSSHFLSEETRHQGSKMTGPNS